MLWAEKGANINCPWHGSELGFYSTLKGTQHEHQMQQGMSNLRRVSMSGNILRNKIIL
jgi:hypothetical protein